MGEVGKYAGQNHTGTQVQKEHCCLGEPTKNVQRTKAEYEDNTEQKGISGYNKTKEYTLAFLFYGHVLFLNLFICLNNQKHSCSLSA